MANQAKTTVTRRAKLSLKPSKIRNIVNRADESSLQRLLKAIHYKLHPEDLALNKSLGRI